MCCCTWRRFNELKLNEFDVSSDSSSLTSRIQFRRNVEITNSLIGSVISHAIVWVLIMVLIVPIAPFLGDRGYIQMTTEYEVTCWNYFLANFQLLLHPVLTVQRSEPLKRQLRLILGLNTSNQSYEIDEIVCGKDDKSLGRATQQNSHFDMLQNMWDVAWRNNKQPPVDPSAGFSLPTLVNNYVT